MDINNDHSHKLSMYMNPSCLNHINGSRVAPHFTQHIIKQKEYEAGLRLPW